jgi:hypothetical protein
MWNCHLIPVITGRNSVLNGADAEEIAWRCWTSKRSERIPSFVATGFINHGAGQRPGNSDLRLCHTTMRPVSSQGSPVGRASSPLCVHLAKMVDGAKDPWRSFSNVWRIMSTGVTKVSAIE